MESVQKVVRVLDLFTVERPEWTVSEVARTLEMPKSSASVLLASLAEHRMLRRTENGHYRLGWHLFELGQSLLDTTEFRSQARRVLHRLVETYTETAHLAVLDGVQAVYVEKVQPYPKVKIPLSRAGARLPAHCSGVGKVLLASCDWEMVAEALEHRGLPSFTANTITTLDGLKDELEQVREQGYAYDEEEAVMGLCCVAAPVQDQNGSVVAALSLSVPAFRFDTGRKKYTAAVLEAARTISEGVSRCVSQHHSHRMEAINA